MVFCLFLAQLPFLTAVYLAHMNYSLNNCTIDTLGILDNKFAVTESYTYRILCTYSTLTLSDAFLGKSKHA